MENTRYIGILLADTLFEDVDTSVYQTIKKYVELRINMLDDLQIKYYLRGFRDCISLLLKCGLLNQND